VCVFDPVSCPFDGVDDAVCESHVRVGTAVGPVVLGDPGRNRVAGGRLAPVAGEQDERQIRLSLADRIEKLDARLLWQVVASDDTVELVFAESVESIGGGRRCLNGDTAMLLFESTCSRIDNIRIVVDVEHADPVSH